MTNPDSPSPVAPSREEAMAQLRHKLSYCHQISILHPWVLDAINTLIAAVSRDTMTENDQGAEIPDVDGTEPRLDWQPIVVAAAPGAPIPARAAWLYEKSCGVRLGTFGRFSDGCAFATVPGMNGCFIREWGATHVMVANIPEPPEAKWETEQQLAQQEAEDATPDHDCQTAGHRYSTRNSSGRAICEECGGDEQQLAHLTQEHERARFSAQNRKMVIEHAKVELRGLHADMDTAADEHVRLGHTRTANSITHFKNRLLFALKNLGSETVSTAKPADATRRSEAQESSSSHSITRLKTDQG